MSLVSSGQITIVDNNDAKQLVATLSSSAGVQQIYSAGNLNTFLPDFYTYNTNVGTVITASVYRSDLSAATEICGTLTNRKFTIGVGGSTIFTSTTTALFGNSTGTAISTPFTATHTSGSQSTLAIKGNLLSTSGQFIVGFEGDYTDPTTGLVTHVLTSISFSTIVTGTDANYVLFRGANVIEGAVGTTKNYTALAADFYRGASGLDNTNLVYKWYETVSGAFAQISTSTTGYASKYGLKTVANPNLPSAIISDLGVNVPTSGNSNAYNTLVLSEKAVLNSNTYKVEIFDTVTSGTTTPIAIGYITVNDVSDMYRVSILSTTGDKLANGVGSTTLTPYVTYGDVTMSSNSATGYGAWKFIWQLTNKSGKRAAFIDTSRTAYAAGRSITANTTGISASFTYGGTAITFIAGDIIKIVTSAGLDYYYEVASSTINTVTIRTPIANTWLNYTDYPAPTLGNDPLLTNGKFYACNTPAQSASISGTVTALATTTTVTGITAANLALIAANMNIVKVSGAGAFGTVTKVDSVDTVNLLINITSTTANTAGAIVFTVAAPVGSFLTTGTTGITVTGDDIDAKGIITVEANRP